MAIKFVADAVWDVRNSRYFRLKKFQANARPTAPIFADTDEHPASRGDQDHEFGDAQADQGENQKGDEAEGIVL